MNNAALNICIQVSAWTCVLSCLGRCLGVELPSHVVILYLTFGGRDRLFSYGKKTEKELLHHAVNRILIKPIEILIKTLT